MSKTYQKLIRLSEVLDRYPVSRSTLYKQIKQGVFPRPIQISDRSVAWIESEISQILFAKIQNRGTEDTRRLVSALENERNRT